MRARPPSGIDLASQDDPANNSDHFHNSPKTASSDTVLEMVYFGGTILMTVAPDGGHIPFFTPLDIAYYQAISQSKVGSRVKENLTSALLRYGSGHHEMIKNVIAPASELNLQEHREKLLNDFGFHRTYQRLAYNPIDSINFDAEQHLPSLLAEVTNVMNNGHVPVILGGTDSLSKYGPLLHAELAQREAKHLPVLIVSSMYAFGDAGTEKQNHVVQLFKAAKSAAHQLIERGETGVYALVPENKEVTKASVISMRRPVEKISGNVVQAFVGLDSIPVNLDAPLEHKSCDFPSDYETHIPNTLPQSLKQSVMLPIESYNSPNAVTRALEAIATQNHHHFDAIIIKGLPITESTLDDMSTAIRSLKEHGTKVVFAAGFKYSNKEARLKPILKEGELEAKSNLLQPLITSGAIFLSDISSTQAYIQASMGKLPKSGTSDRDLPPYDPAFFTKREDQNTQQNARRADVLALEFFPNSTASQKTLTLLSNNGMDVVLANYTQGAMPACAIPTNLATKLFVTFHTTGKKIADSDVVESAILDGGYQPHNDIRLLTIAGGETKPKNLLRPSSIVQAGGSRASLTESAIQLQPL